MDLEKRHIGLTWQPGTELWWQPTWDIYETQAMLAALSFIKTVSDTEDRSIEFNDNNNGTKGCEKGINRQRFTSNPQWGTIRVLLSVYVMSLLTIFVKIPLN